jgi:hypothetical protein
MISQSANFNSGTRTTSGGRVGETKRASEEKSPEKSYGSGEQADERRMNGK